MMPDIAAISGALSALKASTDLTKAMLGLRDANLVREKALELNAQIFAARESALEAQSAQSALLEEIRDLKGKIAEFENWDAEKARYQLTKLPAGTFAYAVKTGMEAGEPAHYACAHCFEDRRKSILQPSVRWSSYQTLQSLSCNSCNTEIFEDSEYPRTPQPTKTRSDVA